MIPIEKIPTEILGFILRYYQEECVDAVMANIDTGKPNNLCVEPTGAGKSAIMAELARRILKQNPGKKILFVSHRKELDKQNQEAFLSFNPDKTAGFEKGTLICPPESDVMFASILTVGKEGLKRIRRWSPPKNIAAVFIDEAHHLPGGKTYKTLWEELKRENPNIPVVGLTATPERLDGERIGDFLTELAHEISLEELIEAGYLAQLKGVSVQTKKYLDDVKTSNKEFVEEKLAKAVNTAERNALAARLYKEHHQGEKAMVFAVNVAHANALQETFTRQGINAVTITENTPKDDRDKLKENIRNDTYDVVISVGCLTEGFDLPEIKAIFALRPTKSPVFLLQMLGRGMRLITEAILGKPGEFKIRTDLKTHCTVYDFVDLNAKEVGAKRATSILGLPNADFDFNGEDISEIQGLFDLATHNAIAAEDAINAKSPAELKLLLLPFNILQRCLNRPRTAGSTLPWVQLGKDRLIILNRGETCRIHTDARGITSLSHPELNIKTRGGIGPNIPKRTIELRSTTPIEQIKEAESLLQAVLNYDRKTLDLNAPWREEDRFPSPEQIKRVRDLMVLDEEEIQKLTVGSASQVFRMVKVKREALLAENRMPDGRYEGVEIPLVAFRNPEYLLNLLKQRIAKQWGAEEKILKGLKTNPLDWMKTNRRGLYMRYLHPEKEALEKLWNSGATKKLTKIVLDALGTDPKCPWDAIEQLATDRMAIYKQRNPEKAVVKQAPGPIIKPTVAPPKPAPKPEVLLPQTITAEDFLKVINLDPNWTRTLDQAVTVTGRVELDNHPITHLSSQVTFAGPNPVKMTNCPNLKEIHSTFDTCADFSGSAVETVRGINVTKKDMDGISAKFKNCPKLQTLEGTFRGKLDLRGSNPTQCNVKTDYNPMAIPKETKKYQRDSLELS